MSKQETDLPGCGHEMMSGRGRFNRTAHSLTLVRYSHIIRPRIAVVRISRAVLISSFSRRASSDPLAPLPASVPWVRLPHRRHLSSPRVIIALSRPARRLVRRGAWRDDVIRIVSSARCRQASRMAGGRGRVVHVVHVVHVIHVVLVLISWRALRYGFPSSIGAGGKQAGNGAMLSMRRRVQSSSPGVSSHRSERAGRRHPCRGVSKQATAAVSSSLRLVCRLVGASRLIPPGRPVRR